MLPLSLAEIARVTGGEVHGDPDLVVDGAAYVDNRSPVERGLFVASAGERTDELPLDLAIVTFGSAG